MEKHFNHDKDIKKKDSKFWRRIITNLKENQRKEQDKRKQSDTSDQC